MFSFFYICDIELPNVSKPCHLHFKKCSEYLVVGSVVCNFYFTKRWLVIPISEPTTLVWLWPLAVLYSYYGFWLYLNLDNFCSSLCWVLNSCWYVISFLDNGNKSGFISRLQENQTTYYSNYVTTQMSHSKHNSKIIRPSKGRKKKKPLPLPLAFDRLG